MADGENPKPGGQFKTWQRGMLGDSEPPKDQRNIPPWWLGLRLRCGTLQQKGGEVVATGPRSSLTVRGEMARNRDTAE